MTARQKPLLLAVAAGLALGGIAVEAIAAAPSKPASITSTNKKPMGSYDTTTTTRYKAPY